MSLWTRRLLGLLAVAAWAAVAPAQFVFTQPTSGTTGNFTSVYTAPGGWLTPPGVPTAGGAATATLSFNTLTGSSGFVLTNDLAGAYLANGLTFANTSTGTFTLAGPNGLTLGGANPFVAVAGPGAAQLGQTGDAVTLNPSAGTTTVGGAGNGLLTLAASLGGTGGLTVSRTGFGLTTLAAANTFTGGLTLGGGAVTFSADTQLGDAANGVTFTGGALQPTAALTTARPFTFTGAGTIGGAGNLTLSGNLSGAGPLTKQEVNTLTLTGSNAAYTGAVTLGAQGPVVVGSAVVGFGSTTGLVPSLALSGEGRLAAAGSLTLNNNQLLAITRGAATSTAADRLGTVPLTLSGGGVSYSPGSAAPDSTSTLGAVTLSGGLNVFRTTAVAGDAGGTQLTFGALTRANGAVLQLGGNSAGTGQIGGPASANTLNLRFASGVSDPGGAANTPQRGVIPWAGFFGTSTTSLSATGPFVAATATYDANGFRPLRASEYNTGLLAGANVILNTNTTLAADISVNSLNVQGSAIGVSGGNTLTVASGSVVSYFGVTFTDSKLAFPAGVTGYLHQADNVSFAGTSAVSGDSGLVISSFSTDNFRTTFSNAANPFTGGLVVNGRLTAAATTTAGVNFSADAQLGAAGQPLTLNGGQLNYTASAADASFGTRPVVLSGPGLFTVATAARTVTVPGGISGAGALVLSGPGTLSLTGTVANTYSGGTHVTAGTLQASAANQLGTGPVFLGGGTLKAAGNLTFGPADTPAGVTASAGSTLDTQANTVTLGQPLATASGSAVTLTKAGTGILVLSNANPQFGGTLAVSAGSAQLTGANGALPQAAAVTLAAGTRLTFDNAAAYNPNRFADTGTLALNGAGAVVSYVGGSASLPAVAERFGTLASTAAGGVFTVTGNTTSPTVLRFSNLSAGGGLTIRGDLLGDTAGNYTRVLFDNFTSNQGIIPNVFFASTAGTGTSGVPAAYDLTRGVIQLTPTPTTGVSINNFAPDNVPVAAAFTTTGSATAATGASVYSLVLDAGSTLALNGGNAASGTNASTPDGTLALSGGQLTSQNGAKTITSTAARTVSFGPSAGQVTTTSALTLDPNVTLAGSGGLTKLGTDVLTVSGPYAVTGGLTVSAGTLAVNGAISPGTTTVATGATLSTSGNLLTAGDLSGAGTVTTGAGGLTVASSGLGSTFSGTLTTTGPLTKTGTGPFTFAPANSPAVSSTTVAAGTLVLGNANAATSVLAGAGGLTLGSGATGGTVDLNGFSPAGALTAIATGGTSTANGITNGNAATPSAVTLNFAADTTVPVQFGGNLAVTKTDATTLVLTGSAGLPATTTGAFNVNAGILQLNTGGTGLGSGMSVSVAGGATFRLSGPTGGTNNAASPFGTVTVTGTGQFNNAGTSFFDTYLGRLVFANGGAVNSTAGGIGSDYHFVGAGISSQASNTTATFASTNSGDSIQNDTAVSLPISVARGTVPNGVDLDMRIAFSGGVTPSVTKTGPGTLLVAGNVSASSHAFVVNGGTLLAAGVGTGSGAVTVNSGGVLKGTGTVSGPVTVTAGGLVGGGDHVGQTAPTAATGTLTSTANVTLANQGGLTAVVGAGGASQLSLTGTAVLNLNPGAGNKFVINLVANPADPLVPGTQYTYTLATVATAGNLQLNGATLANGAIDPATYTLTGVAVEAGYNLNVIAQNQIQIVFTPVPEPATMLAVAGLGLGAVRLARRRRTTA